MAWYSLLPSHLTTYETWVIRAFLILAIINIAPWILAILYDVVYYIGRQIWHEVPIWGGRARGRNRPRAPSLRDRRMSFRDIVSGSASSGGQEGKQAIESRRGPKHQKTPSTQSIEEENENEDD